MSLFSVKKARSALFQFVFEYCLEHPYGYSKSLVLIRVLFPSTAVIQITSNKVIRSKLGYNSPGII